MELSFSAIPYQFNNKIQEAKNNMEKYRAVCFFPSRSENDDWQGDYSQPVKSLLAVQIIVTTCSSAAWKASQNDLFPQYRKEEFSITECSQSHFYCQEVVMPQTAGRVDQSVLPPGEKRLTRCNFMFKVMPHALKWTIHMTYYSNWKQYSQSQHVSVTQNQGNSGKKACKLDICFKLMISVIIHNLFKQ